MVELSCDNGRCDHFNIVKRVHTSTLSLLGLCMADTQQISHITSNNASNNMTMIDEFAVQYHCKVGRFLM